MKPINVVHLKPFASDGWKSIERYGRLISHLNDGPYENVTVRSFTPSETLKSVGAFWGRRVFAPFAVRQFRHADVVHILDAAYSNLVLFLNPSRTIATCHDVEIWRTTNFLNRPVRHLLLKQLSGCATVVTPSQVVADQLVELFQKNNFVPPLIKVISNAVDPMFTPSSDRTGLRDRLGIKSERVLLYVANTAWPRKNFEFLLNALERTKKINAGFKLVHLGPALAPAQRALVETHGLNENWQTFSNVSDVEVLSLYQLSDLVLIPSQYEGFGYPIVESSACGIPFLASDIPTFRELLPLDNSLLPLSEQLWADKIDLFFQSDIFKKELESQTRYVAPKFHLANHLKEYAALYASIAKTSTRG